MSNNVGAQVNHALEKVDKSELEVKRSVSKVQIFSHRKMLAVIRLTIDKAYIKIFRDLKLVFLRS